MENKGKQFLQMRLPNGLTGHYEMNVFQRILAWAYTKWVVIPLLEKKLSSFGATSIRIRELDVEDVETAMREKRFHELH